MNIDDIDWQGLGGLIPAIVQDAGNGAVLMLGWVYAMRKGTLRWQ